MKNFKIVMAGLIALSFVACSSADSIKDSMETGSTLKNTKDGNTVYKNQDIDKNFDVDGDNYVGLKIIDESDYSVNNKITVKNNNAIGVVVISKDNKENTVTNNGEISVEGEDSFGMFAEGKGATVVNATYNTIYLNGHNQKGMYALNGGHVVNKGTIDLTNADHSFGMFADGKDAVIDNFGTIKLATENKNITNNNDNGFGHDNKNNIGLKAINGGEIKNHGHIKFQ